MRRAVVLVTMCALSSLAAAAQNASDSRAVWVALARGGYALPEGRQAIDVLLEVNALLASPDPVLRDDVAFGAAERWIRDGRLTAGDLRRLLTLWMANTADGLGAPADDRVFKRSFSALCLSLIAARDLAEPFLEPSEVSSFFDGMLDYFQRESDVRGFDPVRGWMHTVAHTIRLPRASCTLRSNGRASASGRRRPRRCVALRIAAQAPSDRSHPRRTPPAHFRFWPARRSAAARRFPTGVSDSGPETSTCRRCVQRCASSRAPDRSHAGRTRAESN